MKTIMKKTTEQAASGQVKRVTKTIKKNADGTIIEETVVEEGLTAEDMKQAEKEAEKASEAEKAMEKAWGSFNEAFKNMDEAFKKMF